MSVALQTGTLINYVSLNKEASDRGEQLFNLVPKVHYLAHLPDVAEVLNPRYVRNYAEESFVGTVARIYGGVRSTAHMGTTQAVVLTKYMIATQLLFDR